MDVISLSDIVQRLLAFERFRRNFGLESRRVIPSFPCQIRSSIEGFKPPSLALNLNLATCPRNGE